MAGVGLARRSFLKALGGEQMAVKTSLQCATRHFSTTRSNWRNKGTTDFSAVRGKKSIISPSRLSVRTATAPAFTRSNREFSSSSISQHGHLDTPKPGEGRKVTFITKEGDEYTFEVADGANLLDIAQANDLEMEGACGGSCACSTCHVIVENEAFYDKMEEPDDDENDMLDLAFGLTETSRLGCQVVMSKELDGLVVRLPSMTRNLQASDFNDK